MRPWQTDTTTLHVGTLAQVTTRSWRVVDRCHRHPNLNGTARSRCAIPRFDGEGIECAVSIGDRGPGQTFTTGEPRATRRDSAAVFSERAAGNRFDTERQRIPFNIALIGGSRQSGVGDGVGGVFRRTYQHADAGKQRRIIDSGNGHSTGGAGREAAVRDLSGQRAAGGVIQRRGVGDVASRSEVAVEISHRAGKGTGRGATTHSDTRTRISGNRAIGNRQRNRQGRSTIHIDKRRAAIGKVARHIFRHGKADRHRNRRRLIHIRHRHRHGLGGCITRHIGGRHGKVIHITGPIIPRRLVVRAGGKSHHTRAGVNTKQRSIGAAQGISHARVVVGCGIEHRARGILGKVGGRAGSKAGAKRIHRKGMGRLGSRTTKLVSDICTEGSDSVRSQGKGIHIDLPSPARLHNRCGRRTVRQGHRDDLPNPDIMRTALNQKCARAHLFRIQPVIGRHRIKGHHRRLGVDDELAAADVGFSHARRRDRDGNIVGTVRQCRSGRKIKLPGTRTGVVSQTGRTTAAAHSQCVSHPVGRHRDGIAAGKSEKGATTIKGLLRATFQHRSGVVGDQPGDGGNIGCRNIDRKGASSRARRITRQIRAKHPNGVSGAMLECLRMGRREAVSPYPVSINRCCIALIVQRKGQGPATLHTSGRPGDGQRSG